MHGSDSKKPAPAPVEPAVPIAKTEPAPAPLATPPEPTPVAPTTTVVEPPTPKAAPKSTTPKTPTPKTPKAGTGSATVAPIPAPPVETAAKPIDAGGLATQYQLVGAQLKDLQTKKGADATSDLWPRYRYVNLSSAMATQQSRDAANAILTKLASEIRTRSK
jgi:hypothetical protein